MRSILPITARQGHRRDVVQPCQYLRNHDVCKLICVKSTQGRSAGMPIWNKQ